jgi:hypothetical protein
LEPADLGDIRIGLSSGKKYGGEVKNILKPNPVGIVRLPDGDNI